MKRRVTMYLICAAAIVVGLIVGLLVPRLGGPSSTDPNPTTAASPNTSGSLTDCTSDQLKIGLNPDSAGAGHNFYDLIFVNTSQTTCILNGFAAVSLVDASNAQLGDAAAKVSVSSSALSVPPAGIAHAIIDFPDPANFSADKCSAVASSLKVIPPSQITPLYVVAKQQACPGWSVQPIMAGGHS